MTATIYHLKFKRPGSPTTLPAHLVFGERDLFKCDPDWIEKPRGALLLPIICCDPENCAPDWIARARGPLPLHITCCEDIEKLPTILGDMPMLAGEALEAGVEANFRLSPDFYAGEALDVPITTFPVVVLPVQPMLTGESLSFALSLTYNLPSEFYTGETQALNTIVVPPVINMEARGYTGETLERPGLITSVVFVPEFYTGESLAAVLQDYPSHKLEAPFYTGETLDKPYLTPSYGFPTEFVDGAGMVVEKIDNGPQPNFESTFYDGAAMELNTIERYQGMRALAYTGESMEFSLSVQYVLPMNSGYDGQVLQSVLNTSPPALLEARGFTGEWVYSFMNVGHHQLGYFIGANGETMLSDLATRPQPGISTTAYTGEVVLSDLRTGAGLGLIDFRDGGVLSRPEIELDDLIKAYTGEVLEAELATETTFSMDAGDGQVMRSALDTRPSEPLGRFVMYDGAAFESGPLRALEQIQLAATINYNTLMYVAIDATTYFDMGKYCCFSHPPGQQDFHQIEMNHADAPDATFSGDTVCMYVDLQTQQRFQPRMHDGAAFQTLDHNPYFAPFDFYNGQTMSFNFEAVQDFPLCPGNFIPEGDNVYVELEFEDDTLCESDYAYAGEALTIGELEAYHNPQPRGYHGETMLFDLKIDPMLTVRMYTGEHMRDYPEVVVRPLQDGQVMRVEFYTPPYLLYTGEEMTVDIKSIFEVEFLESGCLDNEYEYQDENGDPVPELFNPVPVEVDPYRHDVKAHCF